MELDIQDVYPSITETIFDKVISLAEKKEWIAKICEINKKSILFVKNIA